MQADVKRLIVDPLVRELATRSTPLQGALYPGVMLTSDGPKVIEFNARLGDPETQVMLPLLDDDFVELLWAVATGSLGDFHAKPQAGKSAVGVVLASGGYPGPIRTGLPVKGLTDVPSDVIVFHAGTRRSDNGGVVTAGGRVLTVVGLGDDLETARKRAYAGVEAISFEEMHYRRDIAARPR
jgi:phosphoribosylamine--glycine ligase